MTDFEDLAYTVTDGLATIAIDRQDRYNAFRARTVDELIAAFKRAWADPQVGVVCLTGRGEKAFCVGGDQKEMQEKGSYGTSENDALARRLGLPLIAKFRAQYEREREPAAPTGSALPAPEPTPAAPEPSRPATSPPAASVVAQHHSQAVRTGQQVYARGCDLVVVAPVANGAEVLADGNIHVYGPLRGRAFAGALGDERARIFCSEFRAELISIAGHYRVFEEIPAQHEGKAVQIHLDGNKLKIAPL